MSFIASILDSLFVDSSSSSQSSWIRRGKYGCVCGAIQIDLNVPPSSYVVVEQTTALCHCHDCFDFVKACGINGQKLLENNATQLVQFYKSDIKVVKGQNDIGYVRLRSATKSPMIRCYCKKCGTPLGADIDSTPLLLLYNKLIQVGSNMPLYLPHLVLNYASAPRDTTRPYDRYTVVRQGILAPYFIFCAICRLILGLIMQKGTTTKEEDGGNGGVCGFLGGLQDFKSTEIPIGIDKIKISSSSEKKSD